MTIKLTGAVDVLNNMKKKTKLWNEAAQAALYQQGFRLAAESTKLVPVETGRLWNTRYVAPPTKKGGLVIVEVGYGTNYAIYVHEMPSNNNFTRAGSGPFYLWNPYVKLRAEHEKWIAKKTEQNFNRFIGIKALSAEFPKKPRDRGEAWQRSRQKSIRKKGK